MQQGAGVLYVVATPIGNLGDIGARALEVLSEVDLIAAEDTRETKKLLNHFGITARLVAYHDYNEAAMTERLLAELEAGCAVALVSDAGTPLISDPGYRVVSAARERAVRVVPIPGASAVICALSASGLPSDRFLFLGFPPRAAMQRLSLLKSLVGEPGTLVLYESGKRALALLADIQAAFGEGRRVVIARELTKRFETFLSGVPPDLIGSLESDETQRLGELVVLIEGAREDDEEARQRSEWERVMRILCDSLPLSQAASLAAQITGGKKNRLYRLGLELGLGADRALER